MHSPKPVLRNHFFLFSQSFCCSSSTTQQHTLIPPYYHTRHIMRIISNTFLKRARSNFARTQRKHKARKTNGKHRKKKLVEPPHTSKIPSACCQSVPMQTSFIVFFFLIIWFDSFQSQTRPNAIGLGALKFV